MLSKILTFYHDSLREPKWKPTESVQYPALQRYPCTPRSYTLASNAPPRRISSTDYYTIVRDQSHAYAMGTGNLPRNSTTQTMHDDRNYATDTPLPTGTGMSGHRLNEGSLFQLHTRKHYRRRRTHTSFNIHTPNEIRQDVERKTNTRSHGFQQ